MINPKQYHPLFYETPEVLAINSAWKGLETIIKSIIKRFGIKEKTALEFGVEYGFSTSCLAFYFDNVIGVDTFEGDEHSGKKNDHLEFTRFLLSDYKNIQLIKSDFREFIKKETRNFDLIHIDIVHTYKETFDCGAWAVHHGNIIIFHDTESYQEVKRAVSDLAEKYDMDFYNYPYNFGLGILIRKTT